MPQHSRFAIFVVALSCGCGGEPVGGKIPKANPAHVGGAVAAAAALATLADPKAARQHQEQRGGERKEKSKKVKETVPESILFAPATDGDEPSADGQEEQKLPPCKPKAPGDKEAPGKVATPSDSVDLFPPLDDKKIASPKKCREVPEKSDTSDGEAADKSPNQGDSKKR